MRLSAITVMKEVIKGGIPRNFKSCKLDKVE